MPTGREPRPVAIRKDAEKPGPVLPKLSITTLALLVAGLGVVASMPRSKHGRALPEPQKAVELERYLGRWFELARYDTWFERGCEAVTAEYSLRPDGLIRVVNSCRRGGPLSPLRSAEAKARVLPGTGNAKLKVAFFGPFFWGDYWVLDHADDYSWSIVGGGSRRYLWLLTREATVSDAVRAMLIGKAQSLGYDTANLHLTEHPAA